jgi:hypothetical protein
MCHTEVFSGHFTECSPSLTCVTISLKLRRCVTWRAIYGTLPSVHNHLRVSHFCSLVGFVRTPEKLPVSNQAALTES